MAEDVHSEKVSEQKGLGQGMIKAGWRSLRTRIVLLAIVTCAFLAIAAASFYSFLQSSHSTTVRKAESHLARVAETLLKTYLDQASSGVSLQSFPIPPRPGEGPPEDPPPPPPPFKDKRPPHPPPPPKMDPLSQLTGTVLQREDGIEGGFLAGAGPLVGYAFPTHEGPGSEKEMPQRERPTIDRLAHEAERTGSTQTFSYEGQHDVVLFVAMPVRETVSHSSQPVSTGAVWLMQRLPDVNRGRSRQLLLGSAGFATAALLTALLAFMVTFEIRGGVTAVMNRLGLLEQEFSSPPRPEQRPQLAEFEKVLGGIDTLASSLQKKIENERALESELRHRERLASLGQFAAGIAHELRNPLATIRLRAQMSQHASKETPVAHHSHVILEEVDRLDTMIGRLLYFSRPISLDLRTLNLQELCSAASQAWSDRPLPNGVEVTCDMAAPVAVRVDRTRLLQVLNNLVENAVQSAATREAGTVVISASLEADALVIRVIDNGEGFDETSLRHALDPFFTTKETGTGLGLSIAFELVEAHGGVIELAGRPEGGAIVTVRLPQSHSETEALA